MATLRQIESDPSYLGSEATMEDAAAFAEAVIVRMQRMHESEADAIEYMWKGGDFHLRLITVLGKDHPYVQSLYERTEAANA